MNRGRGPGAPLAQSVALAFEGHDVGVVDEAVDQGGGDHRVAEDFAPGFEAAVAGDDDRAAFVAAGDEREEQVGGLALEGQVADRHHPGLKVSAKPGMAHAELGSAVTRALAWAAVL